MLKADHAVPHIQSSLFLLLPFVLLFFSLFLFALQQSGRRPSDHSAGYKPSVTLTDFDENVG